MGWNLDLITGGNLSGARPRFERVTRNFGTVLLGDGHGGFRFLPATVTGLCILSDVRDIVQDKRRIISSRNNDPEVYELK
jgi:hypothetical protein